MGIIRQVEVELDNTLRDLRDSHKEESSKLKKWRVLNKDVQAKLADFKLHGKQALTATAYEPFIVLVSSLCHFLFAALYVS